jgi:hypothetical protein
VSCCASTAAAAGVASVFGAEVRGRVVAAAGRGVPEVVF